MNGRSAVKTRPRRCRTRQDGNGHRETAPPFDRTGAHLRKERRRKARSKTESTGASTEAGGWKAEVGRTHLLTTVLQNIRGLVRKESSWDRVSALVPWTRTANEDRANGCDARFSRFSQESEKLGDSCSQGRGNRHDGRRSGSCDCIALTGDTEASPRHEGCDYRRVFGRSGSE